MPSDRSCSGSDSEIEVPNEELHAHGISSPAGRWHCLGTGVSGSVYLVNFGGKKCAMKILRTTQGSKKEIDITSYVLHPNVVGYVSDITCSGNTLLLTEALCDILAQVLKDRTSNDKHWSNLPIPTHWNMSCLLEILDVLCYMKKQHLLHGDIHEGNVGFTNDHQLKVLDFGMSGFCLRKWKIGKEKPAEAELASDSVLESMLKGAMHSTFEIPQCQWKNLDLESLTSKSYVQTERGYWKPIFLGPNMDLLSCVHLFIKMQFGIKWSDLYNKAKTLGIGLQWSEKESERPTGEEYKNAELSQLLRHTSGISWDNRQKLKLDGLTPRSYVKVSENEFRSVCFSCAVFDEMLSNRESMKMLLGADPGVFFEFIRDVSQDKMNLVSAREYFRDLLSSCFRA